MPSLFKNTKKFTILFFFVLGIDIIIKMNLPDVPYRYFSKFLVISLLGIFYYVNRKKVPNRKYDVMLIALSFYLLGDLFIINFTDTTFFIIAMILFVLGKAMYCIKFSNNRDFNIIRLLPFCIAGFLLMVFVFLLIIDNLGDFLIPVLLYFFVSLLVFLFAYLRKNDVNKKSYNQVLFGMFVFLFSEVIMVLKTFYTEIPYHQIIIMLSYGLAQYFVVLGIINEIKLPENQNLN